MVKKFVLGLRKFQWIKILFNMLKLLKTSKSFVEMFNLLQLVI